MRWGKRKQIMVAKQPFIPESFFIGDTVLQATPDSR